MFKRIGRFFRKVGRFIARASRSPKIEKHAFQLLDLAVLFGVINPAVCERLKRTIEGGRVIVLEGIDGFENIKVTIDELVGLLKGWISNAFPSEGPTAKSDLAHHILSRTEPVHVEAELETTRLSDKVSYTREMKDDFALRKRPINTEEFIELARRKLNAR